ncbi:pyridoxal phosphate-dependent transferase [Phellopilus nigrolimitatus]|nr:pyridoxal phosphate-dependent transferase [Phellopilus nigrolimitatus]
MPMDIEEFRRAGYQAIDRICDFYYNLEKRNVSSAAEPGYLREALPGQLKMFLVKKRKFERRVIDHAPEQGEDFQEIADDYQKLILPGLTIWQHPSFFAYFPTASTFEGMLGDLYASSTANPGFNVSPYIPRLLLQLIFLKWDCSPACTELEAVVMDWGAKLFGLDKAFYNENATGGGVIQTTASDSVLVTVVAARSLYMRTHPDVDFSKLVVYTTTQTHSLGKKAALVLGLRAKALEVRTEDALALRGSTLQYVLEEDRKEGIHPFILIATVGTTSSGAVDNLSEIFAVAQQHPSLWIHVDAAWAGVTLACPEFRSVCYLDEINRYAHSFCINFHKWGLVNFDCSALWVRDRKYLSDALDITPEYLRTKHGEEGTVIDYRNWHLSLGRRFRSLKLWFVLRSYGVKGFQDYIRKGINLNNRFASLIDSSTELFLLTAPSFALSVFCVQAPEGVANKSGIQTILTQKLYEKLSARKDIAITKTELNGIFCVRFAVGAARTEERHIDAAFSLILEETRKVLSETSLDLR